MTSFVSFASAVLRYPLYASPCSLLNFVTLRGHDDGSGLRFRTRFRFCSISGSASVKSSFPFAVSPWSPYEVVGLLNWVLYWNYSFSLLAIEQIKFIASSNLRFPELEIVWFDRSRRVTPTLLFKRLLRMEIDSTDGSWMFTFTPPLLDKMLSVLSCSGSFEFSVFTWLIKSKYQINLKQDLSRIYQSSFSSSRIEIHLDSSDISRMFTL